MTEEPDYKEMYFKMVRATEKAVRILIEAQRECEDIYLRSENEPEETHSAEPEKQARPRIKGSASSGLPCIKPAV